MTFKEAVLEGIKKIPNQSFGPSDEPDSGCVLQTAAAGANIDGNIPDGVFTYIPYEKLRELFPILNKRLPKGPVDVEACDVLTACYLKNDTHFETRESIADWVDSLEKKGV